MTHNTPTNNTIDKWVVQPSELRSLSYSLSHKILDDYKPNFMVVLWRGGATIGCYIHEYLKRVGGINPNHIAIRTSRYTGIGQASSAVKVCSLIYLMERITKESKLLIVVDV